MTLIYKQQTLIVRLNFTKIKNLLFKSDWLITMLFQGQQRCLPRNMSHLVKSGSARLSAFLITFSWDLYPRILHPIQCRLSHHTSLYSESETHLSEIITVHENMYSIFLPPLVLISVGNCRNVYLLVRIFRLAKKVPSGAFLS